jgi:hypothetical protein
MIQLIASGLAKQLEVEDKIMADTGFKSPTASGAAWNNYTTPTNAYTSNNNYAYRAAGYDGYEDYYDFDFNIPSTATINGIEVSVEYYSGGDGARYLGIRKPSESPPDADAYLISRTDQSESVTVFGGSSDLWYRKSWTPSEINDTDFSVYIATYSGNIDGDGYDYVDHVQVKVYYTESNTNQFFQFI